jgi:predicted AlkP superfamily pyrophosphatase or phosphodiesterase
VCLFRTVKKLCVVALGAMFLSCQSQVKTTTPKLLIMISVDQMRADYLTQFSTQMNFVNNELAANGISYTNMHHFHAKTTTAAGHATLATGCYPSTHGIVDNDVYVRQTGKTEYSILDTTVTFIGADSCTLQKVSAAKLQKPSIGDIVKQHDSLSKSYSVALKDRSAILMGGKKANRAFWFDAESTQMVSTDYYSELFPKWVRSYRADSIFRGELEDGWYFAKNNSSSSDIFHIDSANCDADSAAYECGTFTPWFPHTLASMSQSKKGKNPKGNFIWNTPYGDAYVLKFAEQLIENEGLGQDQHCDVLTIGLSAADVIGHQFGPNSREIADYYYRLDRYLQSFVTKLDATVGRENYTLVLTADHGVAPMPEVSVATHADAVRVEYTQFDNDIEMIDGELKQLFNLTKTTMVESSYEGIEPDFDYLNANNIDSTLYLDSLRAKLLRLSYVANVFIPSDFLEVDKNTSEYAPYFANSYDARFGYFVQLLAKPFCLVDMRTCGTTHGTPYAYDTHVPFIIYGNSIKSKSIKTKVYTVDVAPTMLGTLQIDLTGAVDGQNLLK